MADRPLGAAFDQLDGMVAASLLRTLSQRTEKENHPHLSACTNSPYYRVAHAGKKHRVDHPRRIIPDGRK